MLADHREQQATPICESFLFSLRLSLSLTPLSHIGVPTFFLMSNEDGNMFESGRRKFMTPLANDD